MTITLEFAPEEEALLISRTRSQGVEPVAYIRRIVKNDLEAARRHEKNQAAIALLQGWMEEELPAEESAQLVQGWEESMKSLDEHRLSSRVLFPARES